MSEMYFLFADNIKYTFKWKCLETAVTVLLFSIPTFNYNQFSRNICKACSKPLTLFHLFFPMERKHSMATQNKGEIPPYGEYGSRTTCSSHRGVCRVCFFLKRPQWCNWSSTHICMCGTHKKEAELWSHIIMAATLTFLILTSLHVSNNKVMATGVCSLKNQPKEGIK